MFPLIGTAEIVTLVADAVVMTLALARWRFILLRTCLVWFAASAATIAGLVTLLNIVSVIAGWDSAAIVALAVACVPACLAVRLIVLRQMSRSLLFRRDLTRPFGWGWVTALSIGVFVLAMLIGGAVAGLTGAP